MKRSVQRLNSSLIELNDIFSEIEHMETQLDCGSKSIGGCKYKVASTA